MAEQKLASISQFLTAEEIHRCIEIHRKLQAGKFIDAVVAEIIEPNLKRINFALGQKNDPRYLAYCIEYVLLKADAS